MSRLFKTFLSVLIAFISVFSIASVQAASYPSKLTNVRKNYLINYSGFNLYYKTYSGGYAFCTSFHVQGVGTSCTLSKNQWSIPVQVGVAAVVKKYNSNKTARNYYYAELAINEFLYYYSGKNSVNRISSYYNVRNFTGVKDFYNAAVDAYNEAKKEYKLELTPSNIEFKLSGDYYVSDKITVKATEGEVGKYSVSLSGDVRAEIYNKDGNSFYVRVNKSDIKVGTTSNIKVTVNGEKTMSVSKRFSCGSHNQTLTPNTYVDEVIATATASISGRITLKGNKVNITKIDSETKKSVSGAVLVVKNASGKEVTKFITSDKAYELKNLEAGIYTISEEKAPNGYKKSDEKVKFTVGNDDKTVNVEFKNDKIKNPVEISKKDATTSKELPGAHLVVKDSNGNIVDEWTSTSVEHKIKNLKAGDYSLTETIAPEGYRLSTTTVEFTVKGDGSTTKVEMLNEPMKNTKVKINKIDSETKKTVSGAIIVVKNNKGKEVLRFKSSDSVKVIDNLEVGEYTAEEVEAPYGYQLNKNKVSFKVGKDDKTVNVEILNTKYVTRVEVSKKDATTSEELPGAHLVVKDSDGNVVEEWISTDKVHIIKGLKEGKFTLSETIAPEGYKLSTTTVEFEVKADGTTTKVEMLNEPMKNTKVKINKIDSETKKTVSGATIVVKNNKGKEVLRFKSSNSAKVIDNLEVGEYTAEEVEAPYGYQLNKNKVSFKVNKDDKTVSVEILNTKNVTRVEVSKKDATTSGELPGAHLVVKDSDGNVVDEWISTDKVHIIKGLKEGKFTLTETIAPEGYRLSTTTVEFEVKADGTTTKVEMLNEPMKNTKVKINKIDADTKESLEGATLIIKDSKGNEVKSFVTTKDSYEITDLAKGIYTVSESKAPAGYELSNEVKKFTVGQDDKEITVDFVNKKTPKVNTVEISKQDATTSEELPGAHLVVKNSEGKVIDEWVSTSEVHIIKGIEAGNYTLTETLAPEGYVLSSSTVEFTVKSDGTTTKVVMYNSKEKTPVPPSPVNPSKHQVEISKQDVTTKSELPGATLIIKDADGNEIDRWVSGTTPHYIELDEGEYTLTEIQAPIGYDLSYEVVKFTVTNTTDITRVVMYNSKTPNTSDRNITSILGMMFISLLGIGGSVFKLKLKKNN